MHQSDNSQILLIDRPHGSLELHHFKQVASALTALEPHQIRVRTVLISIDAANRGWMQGRVHYRNSMSAGQLMAGNGLGEVVESNDDSFAPGDMVFGDLGWQRFAAIAASAATRVPKEKILSRRLSVYGIAGRTAYHGLLGIARAKAGETVLVSAAGGAVGSFVGQIAKIIGCRTIGVAGGSGKCAKVKLALGYDAMADHRSPTFFKDLRNVCPTGIDVYFDNTGGRPLESALPLMNAHGRITCCGAVSQYDTAEPAGPRGVPGLLAVKRLRMEGFLVRDFIDADQQAENDLRRWVDGGQLKVMEDVIDGLENAPAALIGLLSGQNIGKRMVRVAPDPGTPSEAGNSRG
jgi:NADPH-dependent curcumin reductase CurA